MNDNATADGLPTERHVDHGASDAALLGEIEQLRQALWACYEVAGGDPSTYADDELDSGELASLVVDCVRDLRGFFDAARRDLR